jgi:hypothetical protein
MPQQFILMIGIAFVAATVGYMAGGSGTPVAGIAIPAVFGLMVTAVGLLQAVQPNKEFLEFIKAAGDKADTQPDIVDYRQRAKSAPSRVGVALIVFSAAYLSAATLGAKVRIDGLLIAKPPAQEFPWASSKTKPPSISAALEWMALQSRLTELGYSSNRIAQLYAIQVSEWDSANSQSKVTSVAVKPIDVKQNSGIPAATSNDDFLKEIYKVNDNKGNPFTHQSPKELIDKVNKIGVPDGTRSSVVPG